MDAAADKAALRAHLRERLRILTPNQKLAASRALVQALRADSFWLSRERIFGFVPLPSEPDYLAALTRSQSLCVPRVEPQGLKFYELFPAAAGEVPAAGTGRCWPVRDTSSRQGCWEPSAIGSPLTPHENDLILVPGLGFTQEGHRLGRGGGFYDRFLATSASVPTWGIAFSSQLLANLPLEAHDKSVQRVFFAPLVL